MNEDLQARFARLEPLIDRALALEGAARDNFLTVCAEIHPDLIADLRRALAEDGDLPELAPLAQEITREHATDRRGLRAGAWRLLEKIGQGGMGTVYLAERADGAFDKRVAIKLLRGGDDRFKDQLERERRLLARLEHPGIARLIDGGVLPDGQPWLVMELAEGEELDAWLRRMRPSLRRRLRVFLAVCEAVSYAHSVLVVHRDLKPGNIRVASDGGVKLLDFGIAKLLSPEARPGSTRHIALTPEFAAPEQLAGEAVSTRTDVYALGALLYLLLTGRSPHPRFDGNWPGYVEHVNQVDATLASRATGSELAVAATALKGDLDAILARALQRDPVERYPSVDALAQDVRRHLEGRPVLARAQTWQYRSACWLRRHWGVAALLAGIALAIGGGVGGVVWQAREAAAERDAARLEARRSQAVRDYLALMFRDNGTRQEAGDGSARMVLAAAAEGIERSFSSDPALRQQVLLTLAEIYLNIGDFTAAGSLVDRFQALEDGRTPPTLRAQAHVYRAVVDNRAGKPAEACDEVALALPLLEANRSDHQAVLGSALGARGQCRRLLGQGEAALQDYAQAVSIFESGVGNEADLAAAHNNLAAGYLAAGRHAEAERQFQAALRAFARAGRDRSADAASTLNNLAVSSLARGDPQGARVWLQRAEDVQRAATGESAPLGALRANQARIMALLGEAPAALEPAREALDLMHRFTGEDSVDTASARFSLAEVLSLSGQHARAVNEARTALAAFLARLGPAHPLFHRVQGGVGAILARAGQREEALTQLDAAVAGLDLPSPGAGSALANALCERAVAARARRPVQAGEDARRCLELRREALGDAHWETAEAHALAASFQARSAGPETQAALERMVATVGATSPRVTRARAWFDGERGPG